jgi:hypothetical protein
MDTTTFLQPEYYQKVLGAVALVVVLSMLLERALSMPFEWGAWNKWLEDKKLRAPIALVVAWLICWQMKFDLLPILANGKEAWSGTFSIGTFLTASVVAGGSKGAILLFQGILGFGKEAVEAKVAKTAASAAAGAPPTGARPAQWWQQKVK